MQLSAKPFPFYRYFIIWPVSTKLVFSKRCCPSHHQLFLRPFLGFITLLTDTNIKLPNFKGRAVTCPKIGFAVMGAIKCFYLCTRLIFVPGRV